MKICTYLSAIALFGLCFSSISHAGQSLSIQKVDAFGSPIDVGMLVLGHSTSGPQGDWPAKLASALNVNKATDGRNYQMFRTVTGGDGGFLWSRLSIPSTDVQYNRVLASQQATQWCQDKGGVRWSCRRAKLDRGLTGKEPAPAECSAGVANTCMVEPGRMSCVWHENGQKVSQNLSFNDCWKKMDVRIALVQDTTNRSWPIDDYTGDGVVNRNDYFKSNKTPGASACNGTTATGLIMPVAGGPTWVDWNCDGLLTIADSSTQVYAGWMEKLALDLLNAYGSNSVQHVFFTQKPLEMFKLSTGSCKDFYLSEEGTCLSSALHNTRVATPSRPFTQFYQPNVYWEYRGLETLAAKPTLDKRIHLVTDTDVKRMWTRSAKCYESGISGWSIPMTVPRPASIAADNSESDSVLVTTDPRHPNNVGCLIEDHIHHNDNGGWMMADVWYEGLQSYLQ